ncbi:3-phosphoshikimate 1-carboxyvinyltransferase [Weeksellaceae bacterium TAE3-ERU29]|nr:3-phosphoshikimate 1-carboxyvinyltransferase [Weeksellaceae bacterium TAE3-ERU29]
MTLIHHSKEIFGEINIGGSKSESNRWLILQKLYPGIKTIHNLSDAQDTQLLKKALSKKRQLIDIHHAGTAMRFLTAYFAFQEDEVELTGSERMQERPIEPLVSALNKIGANIEYLKKEGFPPIKINGDKTDIEEIDVAANISSQYISALMLVAPTFPNGLRINFTTPLTSKPYIEMTKAQLESIGVEVNWLENGIKVYPLQRSACGEVVVESDWSSASYWFSIAAFSKECQISLKTYKKDSLQGDAKISKIFEENFGVRTYWHENAIILRKDYAFIPKDYIELDLNETPDIAQTIAVTCAGLQIKAKLTGLHTLKIKETDRLLALQNELKKCGVETIIDDDSIEITACNTVFQTPSIDTYNDHRMAMSFAPFALLHKIQINEPEVVEKSYPNYWRDLEKVGFNVLY